MNVISNSDSSSAESNLNINDIYNLVNNNSSIINFKENDAFNSEEVLLLSESQGRRRGRGCGRGRPRTKMLKEINKFKLI
jgi:hypothetical protein